MNKVSLFVLDANVFIEAARRYYAFDLVPAFWDTLLYWARNGRIVSVDRVKDELARSNDKLAKWATGQFHKHFASTGNEEVMNAYRQIIQWACAQTQFKDSAKAEFARANNADAWVVAYALAKKAVVVTHEQLNRNAKRRIPIPNVCRAFNVLYVDTFEMLRQLGVKFFANQEG